MLRDLEEMVLLIIDAESQEYMREAIACYHARSYRAAIVTAVASAMFDLRKKLQTLASSGGASANLRSVSADIDRLFQAQNCYERASIDAARDHAGLIDASEAETLHRLFDLRNACAHPSGHRSRAEEARGCLSTLIDIVLSRPPMFGMTGVTEYLSRLSAPGFFPRFDRQTLRDTVEHELQRLSSSLFPALVAAVVKGIHDEIGCGNEGSDLHKNLLRTLIGLVLLGGNHARSVWQSSRVSDLILNPSSLFEILSLLRFDPKGIGLLDIVNRRRVVELIRTQPLEAKARRAARELRSANALDAAELTSLINSFSATLGVNHGDEIWELRWPEVERNFLDSLASRAGSSTFATANPAIERVQGLPQERADAASDDFKVRYLLEVASVSTGAYPAHEAAKLTREGLGPRSSFADPLFARIQARDSAVIGASTSWEGLVKIMRATGRFDVAMELIHAFDQTPEQAFLAAAIEMKSWPDQEISNAATTLEQKLLAL